MKSKSSVRSGRRPLPIRWTRVISVDEAGADEQPVFSIESDLDVEYEKPGRLPKRPKQYAKPLFYPKDWWRQQEDKDMESNKLSVRNLKAYGKHVTDLRKLFIDRAKDCNEQRPEALAAGLHDAGQRGKKIRNRGSGSAPNPNEIHPSEYMETVPIRHRKRSRTKNKLKLPEKIQIVHQVLCTASFIHA